MAPCFTAISWLVLNKPELVKRRDFLDLFDQLDLDAILKSAKRASPNAPTVTMTVLLAYEMDRSIVAQEEDQAA